MNIKFSSQAVRCRVTRAELDLLLVGRAIELDVGLPRDHTFRVNVRPSALGSWQLDSDPTGIWLTIPRAALESLAASLPSKEGLEQAFPLSEGREVVVSFEVDVREKKGMADGG